MKKRFQLKQMASHAIRSVWFAIQSRSGVFFSARILRVVVISLCLFALNRSNAEEASSIFNEANKSYEQGKYSEAALAYEKMIKAGPVSTPVYFNLGNAYLKSGKMGRAIVAYRTAEQLSPRDPDVRANLAFARSQVSGGATTSAKIWGRFLNTLTLNEWAVLTSVAVSLWFLLLAFRQWRTDRKKAFRGMISVLGLACGLLAVCLSAAIYKGLYSPSAVVVVPEAVVRLGPLEESKSAFTLRDGAEVTVLDKKNDWVWIEDASRRTGWVPQRLLLSVGGTKS